MKKTLMGILTIGAILALAGAAQATILFADNFNSPDNSDINADVGYTGRQGGIVGTVNYSTNIIWGPPSIYNGALRTTYSSALTALHNFIDQAIIDAGGFVLDYDAKGASGSWALGKNTTNNDGEFGLAWTENSQYAGPPQLVPGKFNILTTFAYQSPDYYYFNRPLSTEWHHFRITGLTNSFAAGTPVTVSLEVDNIPVDMSGSQNQGVFTWQQSDLNYFVFGTWLGDSLGGDTAWFDNLVVQTAPVPEPATMLLLGSGLVGLAGFRKKFRKG